MSPRYVFKQLKNERLSPDEKKQMLAAIVQAQRQFPARQVTVSTRWAFWHITPAFRFGLATLSIVVVIGASGSTALAAESALPGDILYPIKININERARAAVAISVESKAVLEERLAERRLEELEKMVETNRLSAKNEAEVTARFDTHKTNMEKNIARLEATGKAKQAATLRIRLNNFTEAKEVKILNTLNIKLKQEIVQQEKIERLEERADKIEEKEDEPVQKFKELKKQKKDEHEPLTVKTEIVVPASIEVKNQLKIKIEKQREERRLEQEEKQEKRQEEKSKKSEERETTKKETKPPTTTSTVRVNTRSEIKIEVKEKSLVAPVINRLGL